MSTDSVSSAHMAEDDVTSQIASYIYPSPIKSGDIESSIFTFTLCSTHVTAVCVHSQSRVAETELFVATILRARVNLELGLGLGLVLGET